MSRKEPNRKNRFENVRIFLSAPTRPKHGKHVVKTSFFLCVTIPLAQPMALVESPPPEAGLRKPERPSSKSQ